MLCFYELPLLFLFQCKCLGFLKCPLIKYFKNTASKIYFSLLNHFPLNFIDSKIMIWSTYL